ncbi:hypothetical protein K1719_047551 [Acacia pycnantha]|nr:hypothetical protein K1719_047551 [Acacia pycnantha]
MESFFLAETVKYLWLLFDLAVGPDNIVENGPYKYIFSTEGHLLPATPQISLVKEHCLYYGSYCRTNDIRQRSFSSEVDNDLQESNDSTISGTHAEFMSDYNTFESTSISGLIKGFCPGLTHGQKYGISYVDPPDLPRDDQTVQRKEPTVAQSHAVLVIPSPSDDHSPPDHNSDQNDNQTHDSDVST